MLKKTVALWLAVGSFAAGLELAWHHPVWPMRVVAVYGLWCSVAFLRSGLWLFVVPACMPFLNFSPWTGWLVFDEFDILLLGSLAAGYGQIAWNGGVAGVAKMPRLLLGLYLVSGVLGLVGLWRGFEDAGGFVFDWYAGYADALNSLRVFKSLGFALLTITLLRQELSRSVQRANHLLGCGMVAGLAVVALSALWERAAFPGLLDFSTNYRTVALFWEMHVGGAAMDFYLALAAPFLAWFVITARSPGLWAGSAFLALLSGYAMLTTFARGVYLAVALAFVLLVFFLWLQKMEVNGSQALKAWWFRYRTMGWQAKAIPVLLLALLAETAFVLEGGTFMMDRLVSTNRDLYSRTLHWRHGVGLLQGPADWWLGKGLGRLPANYARQVAQGEFSGEVRLHENANLSPSEHADFVTIRGPFLNEKLGGQFALTQRVHLVEQGSYVVRLDIRAQDKVDLHLELCERHLLYDGLCQTLFVRVLPRQATWQTLKLTLKGPALEDRPWYAPQLKFFSMSVVNAGGQADFDNVSLSQAQGPQWLENGEFSEGLSHWFPAAQSYFLPWHIDNVFLENLIERGVLGLLIFLALMGYALWQLLLGGAQKQALSPFLAASLCAALLVGSVSSVLDVPRVAYLLYLLLFFSIQSGTAWQTLPDMR